MNNDYSQFAKSDELTWILQILQKFSIPNSGFVKFKFIVDANIVLKDIRWLLLKAKTPSARTDFLELLEADAIECFAPTFLDSEVREKLLGFAQRYSFDLSESHQIWERFRTKIQFIDVGGAPQDSKLRDPKDWPYIEVQKIVEAPIVTTDKDIAAMGGTIAAITVIASLRNYARESAIELKIKAVGGFAVAIPAAVILESVSLITKWIRSKVPRPPGWVWMLAIALIIMIIAYPPSRKWLQDKASVVGEGLGSNIMSLVKSLQPIISEYDRSKSRASFHLDEARRQAVNPTH